MNKSSLDSLAHIANISEDLNNHLGHIKRENEITDQSGLDPNQDSEADRKKTRRLACTCCRQQKSKCDAHARYPLPCTRCATKGLTCELKKGFKRTEKRARLALIEREFAELKRSFQGPVVAAIDPLRAMPSMTNTAVGGSQAPELPMAFFKAVSSSRFATPNSQSPGPLDRVQLAGSEMGIDPKSHAQIPALMPIGAVHEPLGLLYAGARAAISGPSTLRSHSTLSSSSPQQDHSKISLPESALVCEEKNLEDVSLSAEMIKSLFLEYVQNYHPILPIVDVTRGPERIYRLCPALFWVIIYVTLRRYNEDKSLLVQLSPLVKNILAEITISPIARYNPTEEDEPLMNSCSVHSVQAFVLYSMWPPLTSSLSADSSWSTIGVALYQAIRIGLHTSGQLIEQYAGVEEQVQQYEMAKEQMKTWVFCNIVSQHIASAFGYPAFVQFDTFSAQQCDLPVMTRHIMEIAQFEDQVCKTLNLATFSGAAQTNERIALLKVLANQLDDLELKVVLECSQENGFRKLQFILARIHLLSFYFLDAENISPFELSKGLVRLYNASVSLIEHVQMCQAKNSRFVEYLPAVSILNIWQASFFIVKLANSPMKSVIDGNAAKEIYSIAVDLVAKASIMKHDVSYRGSGIMRNMWQLFSRLDEKNQVTLRISIKSRMAASVFFDCLSLLRDKVGLAKLNIKTDVHGNSESNEDGAGSSSDENDRVGDENAINASDDETISANAHNSDKTGANDSQRTTPGSYGSSGRARKKRLLSDAEDPEQTARRIIRTIPLDPQPISASKRSSIFKVVNGSNQTSPSTSVKTDEHTISGPPSAAPQHGFNDGHVNNGRSSKGQSVLNQNLTVPTLMNNNSESIGSGYQGSGSGFEDINVLLEEDLFANNDMLWKDVDSLMNDFGFHA